MELSVEAQGREPREVYLDLDATDDPLPGRQEGRFWHAHSGHSCYWPLDIFGGAHRLAARLRPAHREAADGSLAELQRVVAQLRRHGPRTRIPSRADAGFCREPIMRWGEENASGSGLG